MLNMLRRRKTDTAAPVAGSAWMIYGANGYTGELIAREAVRRGLTPVLAGRQQARIEPLARELGLSFRVFSTDDASAVRESLTGIGVVLNCAGPFAATATAMIKGCVDSATHYLDVTGEIDVFEQAQGFHAEARRAGIVVCPGVGFDVIPSDCLAAALKAALPDATGLALGFQTGSSLSPGTAKTAVEGLQHGGRIRRGGKLLAVPQAWHTRQIDYGRGERHSMTIPWGDVSTAFWSTGIPDIRVYVPVPRAVALAAKAGNYAGWLWRQPVVIGSLKGLVDRFVAGPDDAARAASSTYLWGEAVNAAGERRTARLRTASVYDITVTGALAMVERMRTLAITGSAVAGRNASRAEDVQGGYFTPSQLMGHEFVTRLPGSSPIELT